MSEQLKKSLEELRDELKQINSDDPKLVQLADDVQQKLMDSIDDIPFVDSLKDAAESFEVHHPKLTAIINNVMSSLSSIGI